MRAAVAVDACGCMGVSSYHGLGMQTAIVGGLLIRVAGGAGDFLGRRFVSEALDVSVAVDACEHAAMNGTLERLGVDVKADGFPVHLVRQCCVAVTGEALVSCGFGRIFLRGSLQPSS